MKAERMPVFVPGITTVQEIELEQRILDFEEKHEQDLVHGGPGYVPRIHNRDFIIAWAINIVIGVYYFWAILS